MAIPLWHQFYHLGTSKMQWHHGRHGLINNKDLLELSEVFEETSELLLRHLVLERKSLGASNCTHPFDANLPQEASGPQRA